MGLRTDQRVICAADPIDESRLAALSGDRGSRDRGRATTGSSDVARRLRFFLAIVALASALAIADASSASDKLLATILAEDDANGDGLLVRDEAPVSILFYFDRADTDGNGSIDGFEARAFDAERLAGPQQPERAAPAPVAPQPLAGSPSAARAPVKTVRGMIEVLDRNGDKKLSREEFPREQLELFGKFDVDGTGYIELTDADVLDARRRSAGGGDEARGPQGGRTVVRTVELMDTDGDGLLQKREAPLKLQRVFERFDTNGDGAIDMQEARTPPKPAEGS